MNTVKYDDAITKQCRSRRCPCITKYKEVQKLNKMCKCCEERKHFDQKNELNGDLFALNKLEQKGAIPVRPDQIGQLWAHHDSKYIPNDICKSNIYKIITASQKKKTDTPFDSLKTEVNTQKSKETHKNSKERLRNNHEIVKVAINEADNIISSKTADVKNLIESTAINFSIINTSVAAADSNRIKIVIPRKSTLSKFTTQSYNVTKATTVKQITDKSRAKTITGNKICAQIKSNSSVTNYTTVKSIPVNSIRPKIAFSKFATTSIVPNATLVKSPAEKNGRSLVTRAKSAKSAMTPKCRVVDFSVLKNIEIDNKKHRSPSPKKYVLSMKKFQCKRVHKELLQRLKRIGIKNSKSRKSKKIPKIRLRAERPEVYKAFYKSDNRNILSKVNKRKYLFKNSIVRESFINLDREKLLASFNDKSKTHSEEKMINKCDVVKYKEEPVMKYGLSKQIVFGTDEVSTESKSSFGEHEQELETQAIWVSGPGKFQYALSDPKYIANGWTCLPVLKVKRRLTIYRMIPKISANDWFQKKRNGSSFYDTGERLADVDHDGNGKWFYKSGKVAFLKGKKSIIYSNSSSKHINKKRRKTLARFDQLGNGIIYDIEGNIRLQYNQVDGSILDQTLTPPNTWNWFITKNEPKRIEVYTEKYLHSQEDDDSDHNSEFDDEMLLIERDILMKYDNRVKQPLLNIRMKAFKISDNFAFRIIDQNHIYVCFSEGTVNIRHNVGMAVDAKNVVGIVEVDFKKGCPILF